MNDDNYTDILMQGPAVVEIDSEVMAAIIFNTCKTSEARAVKAANLICDYLIKIHSNPSKHQ
jgi:hypothetical protein